MHRSQRINFSVDASAHVGLRRRAPRVPRSSLGPTSTRPQAAIPTSTRFFSGNRGNGGDQSLQFGDAVVGGDDDDVLIGALGIDVLIGNGGDDVLIGGTEDFNPLNRDRGFGGVGDDVFVWAPGDGNDFFDRR